MVARTKATTTTANPALKRMTEPLTAERSDSSIFSEKLSAPRDLVYLCRCNASRRGRRRAPAAASRAAFAE